jgi:hypothetical protein
MRKLLAEYVPCNILITSRGGYRKLAGSKKGVTKSEENEQAHVTALLLPKSYWLGISTGVFEKKSTSAPTESMFLESLTAVCPFPGDEKTHAGAWKRGTLSMEFIKNNKWYGSVFALIVSSGGVARQYIPRVGTDGPVGCTLLDLWTCSPDVRLEEFKTPHPEYFRFVAEQSAHFCSLVFNRERSLQVNKPTNGTQQHRSDEWATFAFAEDKEDSGDRPKIPDGLRRYYLCEGAPLLARRVVS